MTYLNFLLLFIVPPILLLAVIAWWDGWRGRAFPAALSAWSPGGVLVAHVILALVYTTPWDNYLIATQVWWYDPKLVIGAVIGWVPLEEYTFFILQTILTSLWLWFLARHLPILRLNSGQRSQSLNLPISSLQSPHLSRWLPFTFTTLLWLLSLFLWLSHWHNIQYLSITLSWALLPVMLQLGFGGDILWRQRRLVFWGVFVPTLYLSLVDALAIDAGTWTIAADQSTQIMIGALPLEEAIFFFITNLLIVLGTVLVLAKESQSRAPKALLNFFYRFTNENQFLDTPSAPRTTQR